MSSQTILSPDLFLTTHGAMIGSDGSPFSKPALVRIWVVWGGTAMTVPAAEIAKALNAAAMTTMRRNERNVFMWTFPFDFGRLFAEAPGG
ncbi:MAG: hypothetical protein IPM16_13970 [Chloroflexi bacterium]|nr:hypothetical protein [Chloroflexota bacterium]